MVSPTIREWIDVCLFNDFGLVQNETVPTTWDMVFRVGIHGIWRHRNAWLFSGEVMSWIGTIR